MRQHRLTEVSLFLAAAAALGGCRKKKPPPPVPAETLLTVTVRGQVDEEGEFERGGFRVGGRDIEGRDLPGLAAALRAGKDAAATKGSKAVVRILIVPGTPFGVVRRILTAAARAGTPELLLACVQPGTKPTGGLRFRLPTAAAGDGEAVKVRIWRGPEVDEAIYRIVATKETCRDARVLKAALEGRIKALGVGAGPIILRPADAVAAAQVDEAMAAAMEAGFTQMLFAAEPMLAATPPLPTPKALPPPDQPVPAGPRPPSSFAGATGRAYNVVYLIDRSGSMAANFEQVREELVKSIAKLKPEQHFHVIFFGGLRPKEYDARKLIPATQANRKAVAEFVANTASSGVTQGIPAVRRAFDVLRKAKRSRPGKIIYLLTDGEFRYENLRLNDKVLEEIRTRNAGKEVVIHTLLYGRRTEAGEKVLQAIATENGGRYKHIDPLE